MEIDEVAARLVRQYWAVLVMCVLFPLVVVGVIVARQPATYSANARIITSSETPLTAAAADAVVSQVQGIATGQNAASQALQEAGVRQSLGSFISHISVSGVGASQVVNLTVTDANPKAAQALARALAGQVVTALNKVGGSGLATALKVIDSEIVRLSQNRATLAAEVAANPRNQQYQAKLAGLDQVLANFTGDRGRLLIQASAQGLASVIDEPALPVQPQSKALPEKLTLAGLLGLILAILLASVVETIRPTVPGSQRVGRRLNAPTFGRLTDPEARDLAAPELDNLALRVRLAASHAEVSTVALVDADGQRDLGKLARELEQAMLPATQVRRAEAEAEVSGADQRNGHGDGMTAGRNAPTLVFDKLTAHSPALRVCPIAQMQRQAATGRVGILVVSGPIARAARISGLNELAVSAGWPVLGVVGVPRLSRKSRAVGERREKPAGKFAGQAAASHPGGRAE